MEELIGLKVNKLFVNEDESILIFETNNGDFNYLTSADCCSETWFADILGVKSLLGEIVNTVKKVELETIIDGRCRQTEDEFYGIKIATNKGHIDIIFRNSSNGYYGGSLHYKNQFEFKRPENLTEITDDWSA